MKLKICTKNYRSLIFQPLPMVKGQFLPLLEDCHKYQELEKYMM